MATTPGNSTPDTAADHEVEDVVYVPVCGKCWKAVHLTDDERWVHSE